MSYKQHTNDWKKNEKTFCSNS